MLGNQENTFNQGSSEIKRDFFRDASALAERESFEETPTKLDLQINQVEISIQLKSSIKSMIGQVQSAKLSQNTMYIQGDPKKCPMSILLQELPR